MKSLEVTSLILISFIISIAPCATLPPPVSTILVLPKVTFFNSTLSSSKSLQRLAGFKSNVPFLLPQANNPLYAPTIPAYLPNPKIRPPSL